MTGPEHFRIAERLLGDASEVEPDSDVERYCLGAARVHAALALAAATALGAGGRMPAAECQAWADEASPRLLAAVEAGLALHEPEDEVIYTACAAHVITGPAGRDPLCFDKMAGCPDCQRRTVPTCSHCEHVDEWPCPTYRAILAALTGKETDDGR